VIAYSNAMNFIQRQQLETYLSRKWRIDRSSLPFLPYTHPMAADPPVARPFGPADIGAVVLWLDAGQRSNVQLNSVSRVSTWVDRSRSRLNVSNTLTSGNYGPGYSNTINGIPAVSFNGTSFTSGNSLSNVNFPPIPDARQFFMFAVANPTYTNTVGYGNTNLIRLSNLNGTTRAAFPYYDGSRNRHLGYAVLSATTISVSADAVSVAGQADVLAVVDTNADVSSRVVTRTGAIRPLRGFTSGIPLTRLWIGSVSGNTEFYAGDVGEIIIGNANLSTPERQQMEGYLAWKWGLQGRLPANHSSANVLPTVTQFQPGQLPDLVTWYDFSDRTTHGVRGTCNAAYVLAKDICGIPLVQRRDASQGFFDLSGPNGEPVLHFRDPSMSIATRGNVTWTWRCTVFIVHRTAGGRASTFDTIQNDFTFNFGLAFIQVGGFGEMAFRSIPAGRRTIRANSYPSDAWYLTTIVNNNQSRDISDVNWRVNGVRQVVTFSASSDAFPFSETSPLLFNRQSRGGQSTFGEMLWFNRNLTDYEVDLVECWLAQKWSNALTWTSSSNLFRDIIV
jgi:hypothetical protein